MPLVLRSIKGSNLTANEVDGNFTFLSSSINNIATGSVASSSYAENANLLDGNDSSVFATTGSNTFVGNQSINGSLSISSSLNAYASILNSNAGSNTVISQSTGSFTSAFFKYTAHSGSNARAGELIAVWNSGVLSETDFSTADIGDTIAVTASLALFNGSTQFNITTPSTGWVLKATATYI